MYLPDCTVIGPGGARMVTAMAKRGRRPKQVEEWRQLTRVQVLRDKNGWTQEQLAEYAGTNPSTVGKIERGERDPKLSLLHSIAKALRVSVADLLSRNMTAVPVIGTVTRDGEIVPSGGNTRPTVECPHGLAASDTCAARVGRGASFSLSEDWVIFFDRLKGVRDDAVNTLCVVKRDDASPLMVVRVHPGSRPDTYTLWGAGGPLYQDTELEAASPVRAQLGPALAPIIQDRTAA